ERYGRRTRRTQLEFLVAGQRAVCFTCYSHHFPPRMKKGAPIQPLLTEGSGEVGGVASILKGAPHPNAALLWARWAISEEGQRVYAEAGEHPPILTWSPWRRSCAPQRIYSPSTT